MECGSGASAYAEAALQHSKQVRARLPSPTQWERGGVRANSFRQAQPQGWESALEPSL